MTKDIWKLLMSNVNSCISRNKYFGCKELEVKIVATDLEQKFIDQEGVCYWSSITLNPKYNFIKFHPLAISVDRLDNDVGYEYENIVLTARVFNLGRMAYGCQEFPQVINTLKKSFKSS